jgi:hypothetical protein
MQKPKRIKDKKLTDSYHSKRCIACNSVGAEGHHLTTRAAGGSDEEFNLIPLDRKCHSEVHQIGLSKFSIKYKTVEKWLLSYGWEYDDIRQKWRRN